jgi:hypothetical protein
MTQCESLIAEILLSVLRGQRTVSQLKRQLADGMAFVEERGIKNVEKELLIALAAMESVIQRIERERVKDDRITNN